MTLAELNRCSRDQFVDVVGPVFDGAPWVAGRAWKRRPFASFDDLSTKLIQEVQAATGEEQLAILRSAATPGGAADLAGKYKKKFGFPFLYAVKNNDGLAAPLAEALNRRLKSTPEQEFQVALGNVFRVARFRLEEIVADDTVTG